MYRKLGRCFRIYSIYTWRTSSLYGNVDALKTFALSLPLQWKIPQHKRECNVGECYTRSALIFSWMWPKKLSFALDVAQFSRIFRLVAQSQMKSIKLHCVLQQCVNSNELFFRITTLFIRKMIKSLRFNVIGFSVFVC